MFIKPTITRVSSGFSGYIWLDPKNCVDPKIVLNDGDDDDTVAVLAVTVT